MLDPIVTGAVAALAGYVLFGNAVTAAALSGFALAGGKLALNISRRLVDLDDSKRGANSEIAYVYEIIKSSSKSA